MTPSSRSLVPPDEHLGLPGDPAVRVVHLRSFLRLLLPVAVLFGVLQVAVFGVTGDLQSAAAGAVILTYAGVLVFARWLLDRRPATALVVAWVGLTITAVALTLAEPSLYAPAAFVPLLAVGFALPFQERRTTVRVLVVAWLATCVIGVIGLVFPRPSPHAEWFMDAYRIAAIAAASGLGYLLLGQGATRMRIALDTVVASRASLREAQEQLAREHERLDVTLRSIGDGVIATDGTGRIVFLNAAAERLTGRSAADAAGLAVGDLLAEPVGPEVSGDVVLASLDGSTHIITTVGTPIRDRLGDTVGSVIVLRDVTSRRRMDRRIQESARFDALARLAGGIAHHFNNKLTAIIGHAEFARDELRPGSPARNDIDAIRTISQELADLAHQVLAVAGRGGLAVRTVDVNEIVRMDAHLLRAILAEDVRLELDLADELPPAAADAGQLTDALLHLVRHAAEDGGSLDGVTVRTRAVRVDAGHPVPVVVDGELPAGEYVAVEVASDREHEDPADLARRFVPFASSLEVDEGLGLPAVLGIARGHRGGVQVLAQKGEGTRLAVLFPVAAATLPG